jgi:hypothetical protein
MHENEKSLEPMTKKCASGGVYSTRKEAEIIDLNVTKKQNLRSPIHDVNVSWSLYGMFRYRTSNPVESPVSTSGACSDLIAVYPYAAEHFRFLTRHRTI